MKLLPYALLCLLPCSVVNAAAVELSAADQTAVRQAAQDYAHGWYTGDRARMQRSLHEKLAKRAYLPGKDGKRALDEMSASMLLSANTPQNAERYEVAPKQAEIEILDGFGNAASVKLRMDGWVDYMHLVRDDVGQWRIINVLWELSPR